MIYDKLEDLTKYSDMFSFIMDDLKKNDFSKGVFETDAQGTFGIGLEYQTQSAEKNLWEAHRKNLDIHVLLEGQEIIHIASIDQMKSTKEYENDYELFEGCKQHEIHLTPGYFLVLFPHEVHKTAVKVDDSVLIRKKVYKKLI